MVKQIRILQAASADFDTVHFIGVRNAVFLIKGAYPETLRVFPANLAEVSVLVTVDILLGDDGSAHPGEIHMGKETLRAVDTVSHCGRQHLADFPAELAAAAAQGIYGQAVHNPVLFQPEMGMRIDHGAEPPSGRQAGSEKRRSTFSRLPSLWDRASKAAAASV